MANRTKFAGLYRALDYFYGGPNINNSPDALVVVTAPGATGSGSVTLTSGQMVLTDGTQAYPLATTAPVLVGSGSNQETVTPSAVSNPTSVIPGLAGFTATFSNLHGTGDPVASATAGLQEAINDCHTNGGGTVIVDAAWAQAGGTSGMIAAATIPSGVVIMDNRLGFTGGSYLSASGSLTNTQTKALHTAPSLLVAAPGAGALIVPISCTLENVFLTGAFASGGAIALAYGVAGTVLATATVAATFLTSPTANEIAILRPVSSDVGTSANTLNKGLYIACDTADFTTGAGSLKWNLTYQVLTGL